MRNHKIGVVHYLFCLFVCLFVDSLEVMDRWVDVDSYPCCTVRM